MIKRISIINTNYKLSFKKELVSMWLFMSLISGSLLVQKVGFRLRIFVADSWSECAKEAIKL